MNEGEHMGMFVVLEGVDGCGKSTQVARLAEAMRGTSMAHPPRDGYVGPFVRSALTSPTWAELMEDCREAPVLLQSAYMAAFYEQAGKLCQLLTGGDVVCDRYWLSGVPYGQLHGVSAEFVARTAARLPQPDLWILLDLPPEEAARRMGGREGFGPDLYERDLRRLEKVVSTYRTLWTVLAVTCPGRFVAVDASADPAQVACLVNEAVIARRDWLTAHEMEYQHRFLVMTHDREVEIEVLRDLFPTRGP